LHKSAPSSFFIAVTCVEVGVLQSYAISGLPNKQITFRNDNKASSLYTRRLY